MTRPEVLVPVAFLIAIAAGTVLLALPGMSNDGVGPFEAFFTATSAVCVTGLIVVDTGTDFTAAGQTVIAILIQLGGLGIMTLSVFALVLAGHRVSMDQENTIKESFTAVARWRLGRLLGAVCGFTLVIEGVGCIALYFGFGDWGEAAFHAVSAFCNAGFSTFSNSLQAQGAGIAAAIVVLLVLGGLGFTTLFEIVRRPKGGGQRFSLHARMVFATSFVLWIGGTLLLWAWERNGLGNALFLSASARTAGFETAPVGEMSGASLLILIPLMFIGASPGSTGGGIKTTTLALAVLVVSAALAGRKRITTRGREIPADLVRRMFAVLVCSMLVVFVGIFLLTVWEEGGDHDEVLPLAFEAVSAFATVGLSTGITPDLMLASKVLLCVLMFIGRVGSLSIFLLLVRGKPASRVRYPEERILIG